MMHNTSADNENLNSEVSGNPFAVPPDGIRQPMQRMDTSITRRFTILGGVSGFGYTLVLLGYSLWVHYSGIASVQGDEASRRLLDVLLQCFLSGVGMIVILAIAGAGVGTIIEIVVGFNDPSPPLSADSAQADKPNGVNGLE